MATGSKSNFEEDPSPELKNLLNSQGDQQDKIAKRVTIEEPNSEWKQTCSFLGSNTVSLTFL